MKFIRRRVGSINSTNNYNNKNEITMMSFLRLKDIEYTVRNHEMSWNEKFRKHIPNYQAKKERRSSSFLRKCRFYVTRMLIYSILALDWLKSIHMWILWKSRGIISNDKYTSRLSRWILSIDFCTGC